MQLSVGRCTGHAGKRTGKAIESALQDIGLSYLRPLKITGGIRSAADCRALGRYCPLKF